MINNFIKASSKLISSPSFILNNFDEFMALQDLVDVKILNIDILDRNTFRVILENGTNINKFKEKVDSYIEVSRYNHQYTIHTSLGDNCIYITLIDKKDTR